MSSFHSSDHSCSLFSSNSSDREYYETIIINVRFSLALFSLIGSVFVLFLVWVFKKYKFFTQRLILYTSVAALLSSISYMTGRIIIHPLDANSERFCKFSGFLLLYSDWTVLLATLSITINLLLQVSWRIITERLEILYIFAIFGFPLIVVWIPFTKNDFGPSGGWCWIKSQDNDCNEIKSGRVLQFTLWYFPLYSIICVSFLIYVFILVRVKSQVSEWSGLFNPRIHQQKQLLRDEIKPLLYYPVIYFCVQLFPFINRIYISVNHQANFPLYLLHVLTSPLTGVLIAFAYALDRDTLRRLNWRTIKINVLYRNTDELVRPYGVSHTIEKEPSSPGHHLLHNHDQLLIVDNSDDD